MQATEIRQLNDAELVTKFLDLKEELFTLRFQNATGSLEKHNLIPKMKKDIARVETVLTERNITAADAGVNAAEQAESQGAKDERPRETPGSASASTKKKDK